MKEIIDEVIRLVEDRMDGVVAEAHRVTKNNGQVRTGVCVRPEHGGAAPTVYIDGMVRDGWAEADIAAHIINMYQKHYKPGMDRGLEHFADYGAVKGSLGLQLVNRARNTGILSGMPFRKFLDLAVIVVADIPMLDGSHGVIKVDNALIELWGKSSDEVYGQALENFRREETRIFDVREYLAASGLLAGFDRMCHLPMYAVTSQSGLYGAVRLLDGGAIRNLAGRAGTDLAMLPASIHEVIFVQLPDVDSIQELSVIVQEVNGSDVTPEELLSDHAYIYRRKTGWEYSEN